MEFPLFEVHIPGMSTIFIQVSNFLHFFLYHSNEAKNVEGNVGAVADVVSVTGIAAYAAARGLLQGLAWLIHVNHRIYF